ncbi:trypsin-like serine protease [Nonomuraea phyllanthi]|uniref:trypsin-like serine protease n=1 Tax=Nonomuraea phyllanthi TaxID=2219224 RepID=UPI001884D336|nr:trypsin-like serine protease [Nonomuraea phyllanthi]
MGALVAKSRYSDGTWTYCTGTLVSPTVFLTAAHCGARGQKKAQVSFASQYEPGSTTYTGRFVPDPRYTGKSELHDMAVVIFGKPVPGIQPAQLPSAGLLDRLKEEEKLKTLKFTPVGYGSLSPTKKKGHDQAYHYTDTRRRVSISFKKLSHRWLDLSLTAKGDGSTCFGDSGGPNFLGGPDSHLLVATTISGADDACKATNYDYRLDTPTARRFLGKYVTLP